MSKGDEQHTDPPRRKAPPKEGGGEEKSGRRTACEETDRLTNMATAISAGVALVPIPGTAAALTGMELLLIGAVTRIWGHPITEGYLAGIFRLFGGRFIAAMGLAVAVDVVGMIPGFGTLVKPAFHASVIKFIGSSLREYFTERYGKDHPADITAEEAKAELEKALARMAAFAPDLKEGATRAFKGDAKLLARTLRRIFGTEDED